MKVTRVRVLDGGMAKGKALGTEVLLDVSDTQAIATLHECLTIVEDESTFGHCWEARKHDAPLHDGLRLLTWLADRGATTPLEAYKEDQRRAEEYRQAVIRWQQAMPKCLLPFWEQMQASAVGMAAFIPFSPQGQDRQGQVEEVTGKLVPLLQALQSEHPELDRRILELFRWYGSGQGPWRGFPAYESVAEELLLAFPTSQLITALTQFPLAPTHLEGTARFFAGYHFNTYRQSEAQQIPQALKQSLLAHSLISVDEDRIQRARNAFTA